MQFALWNDNSIHLYQCKKGLKENILILKLTKLYGIKMNDFLINICLMFSEAKSFWYWVMMQYMISMRIPQIFSNDNFCGPTVISSQWFTKFFMRHFKVTKHWKSIFAYPLSPPNTYKASFHATRVCLLRLEIEKRWS